MRARRHGAVRLGVSVSVTRPILNAPRIQRAERRRRLLRKLGYGAGMLLFWLAMIEVVVLLIWAICSTWEAFL